MKSAKKVPVTRKCQNPYRSTNSSLTIFRSDSIIFQLNIIFSFLEEFRSPYFTLSRVGYNALMTWVIFDNFERFKG